MVGSSLSSAQNPSSSFGKGLQFTAKDSTFHLKLGLRYQNLFSQSWTAEGDDFGSLGDYAAVLLVRRARLKFSGFAYSPKLKYKFEIGMSNRDLEGGNTSDFSGANRLILDAWVQWKFYKNLSVRFGQGKLPGNRERLVSSGNLQFVDRSRLNSRFNLDRDFMIMLLHDFSIGNVLLKESLALSQGDGRNVTTGYHGGYDVTARLELLPMGEFMSKGDYVGSAVKRELSPKLALAIAYDMNHRAVRERGQNGSFITNDQGIYHGHELNSFFADLMFKYKGFSAMGEYVDRNTGSKNSFVYGEDDELLGTYYTGTAVNLQAGYMFTNNWELAFRYTDIDADFSNSEKQLTLGVSKFVVGHKLKFQTDLTRRSIDDSSDKLDLRTQVEIHF